MSALPKTMLGVTVVLSLLGIPNNIYFGAARPMAAVFCILFLVTALTDGLMHEYDEQQNEKSKDWAKKGK